MDSESDGMTKGSIAGLSFWIVKAGEKMDWAQGAANVELRRDCVQFGVGEAGASLNCYDGVTFLPLWLGD